MMEIEEFLSRSDIDAATLEDWIEREWLLPQRKAKRFVLSELDAARAHLIRDLKLDFGVNDEGVEIVLHLIDQLHGLRQAVTLVRRKVRIEGQGGATRSSASRERRTSRK